MKRFEESEMQASPPSSPGLLLCNFCRSIASSQSVVLDGPDTLSSPRDWAQKLQGQVSGDNA
jgi:hypothetical protein